MLNPQKLFLFSIIAIAVSLPVHSQITYQQEAPEIILPGTNGDTITLASLKGKVVLVDFWASWCVPCRAGNKKLVKIYPRYKDHGFEILSVSLDKDRGDWKKAILKDKINWPQVIDDGGWDAKTGERWGVFQLPTSYLINKDGKVIGMDLEGKELEKALKALLGS